MKSEWVSGDVLGHVLAALMPANRLAIEVSARYGLRISDVLSLKVDDVKKGRFTLREQKTGKSRRITLPESLQRDLLAMSGRIYIFEGRLDWKKHRTRQAVFKDIKRAAEAFRIRENISPHSARKIYAVEEYRRSGWDVKHVQKLLNHSDEAVTMIYVLADLVSQKRKGSKKNGKC